LREILRMVITDIVINTILGSLTPDRAGMHCPSWDDAFVSSLFIYLFFLILTSLWYWRNILFVALLVPFSYEEKRFAQH